MDLSWITTSYPTVLIVFLSAIAIYIALMVFTRIAGLRSFSKMSSFDFAITIAIGAMVGAAIIAPDPPLLQAVAAIGSLYVLQALVNYLRSKSSFFSKWIDNNPLLLMQGTEILDQNLKKARVSRKELRYKLREANVTQLSQVKAVVLESTGDVNVLHRTDTNHQIDEELLKDVHTGNVN